jgi:hypothetical protein
VIHSAVLDPAIVREVCNLVLLNIFASSASLYPHLTLKISSLSDRAREL